MSAGTANTNLNTAIKLKQYAASASVRDLVADSHDGRSCARMIKILGAGSFTSAKDYLDVLMPGTTPGTLGPLAAGDPLPGNFSSVISADAAFIAFW